jgi:hypothetical protein
MRFLQRIEAELRSISEGKPDHDSQINHIMILDLLRYIRKVE